MGGGVQSEVARVDLAAGRVVHRFRGLGTKSHGIVSWRGSLLMLDSDSGALIQVNPADGSYSTLYTVHFPTRKTLKTTRARAQMLMLAHAAGRTHAFTDFLRLR